MNRTARITSRLLPFALCLLCALGISTAAQAQGTSASPRLRLESLDALAAKATGQTVDITLEGASLRLATQAAGSNDILKNLPPGIDQAQVRDLLSNLQAVNVKVYEFKEPGVYTSAIDPVLTQLRASGSGWSRLVSINEPGASGDKVDVFAANDPARNDRINGIAVVVREPKQLVFGYIAGSIDAELVGKVMQMFQNMNSGGGGGAARPEPQGNVQRGNTPQSNTPQSNTQPGGKP